MYNFYNLFLNFIRKCTKNQNSVAIDISNSDYEEIQDDKNETNLKKHDSKNIYEEITLRDLVPLTKNC